jgi:transcriptional regulator with XRE-family HTH domain
MATRDPFLGAFGRAVRARRSNGDWSQEELAHRAGMHRNYVGGVERGERNLGLLNASALAHALGIELSALMAEAEGLLAAGRGAASSERDSDSH